MAAFPVFAVFRRATKRASGVLGQDPVGDADTRVPGPQHRRLIHAYPSVGDHLMCQLATAVGVGEVGEPVATPTAGERKH